MVRLRRGSQSDHVRPIALIRHRDRTDPLNIVKDDIGENVGKDVNVQPQGYPRSQYDLSLFILEANMIYHYWNVVTPWL